MYCVISLRDVGGSRTTNPDRRLLKRTRTTVAMLRAKNEFTFGAEYTKQVFFFSRIFKICQKTKI